MSYKLEKYDRTDPLSIFNYSRLLVGQSLHSLLGDEVVAAKRKGKGGLGQMVEELFFGYEVNSRQEADFDNASLELKCTPLLKSKSGESYRIKERLVCTMIDYFSIATTSFEDSHLASKCGLMLLLFYLHQKGVEIYDLHFLFRILWQLPEKDLILIKNDYETIASKVRNGEAHLLSEGDTLYLGACRKGHKDDTLQQQPYSDIKANKRAFSLKPAYMRYILSHIKEGDDSYTNYSIGEQTEFELADKQELEKNSLEDILIGRFSSFLGKNYLEICAMLGIDAYQSKSKYADIGALIASRKKSKRLSNAEEFVKSGIIVKTVRLNSQGNPQESMSFKNIDYFEIFDNDNWLESETYEIFTSRFLFIVFKPSPGQEISVLNRRTGNYETEQAYVLDNVFFWTMPPEDLEDAQEYWKNIRTAVTENRIAPNSFWSISDHRKFHVRPKARIKTDKAINPNGGECDKYCYWFNAEYVRTIIDKNSKR